MENLIIVRPVGAIGYSNQHEKISPLLDCTISIIVVRKELSVLYLITTVNDGKEKNCLIYNMEIKLDLRI